MSEEEKIKLSDKITEGIHKAQIALFERKSKLGESVIIADSDGKPISIPAEEILRRLNESGK
ncbi:MAG: hypothetical protein K2J74_04755 [Muribaculaceae bacterium]|nr:hypothetical protein [Muribaculaceae bacterium]